MSLLLLPFSIFLLTLSRVSVNTTNPPAIKHRHGRAAVPLFWHFPPSFVPVPLFHFALRSSRSVSPFRFVSLSPSLSFFFFCKTTASMHVREQPVWIATTLVQHRIINYSRTVVRVHSNFRPWENSG